METSQLIVLAAIIVVGSAWAIVRNRRHVAARVTYEQALADAVADGELTADEQERLASLQKKGSLSAIDVRAAGFAIYQEALNAAAEDAQLTPDEDASLRRLQEQLGLTEADVADDFKQLARLRLLAKIAEGDFLDVPSPIQLVPDELAYWVVQSTLAERLAVRTTRQTLTGITYNVNTTEPFTARGERSALRPSEDILPTDLGILVITSRRTVFQGAKSTVSVPHARLESITLYSDGLRIDEIKPPARRFFLTEDPELAAAALLQAARLRRSEIRKSPPGRAPGRTA